MKAFQIKALCQICEDVAKEAGALIKRRFDGPRKISKKGPFDLVTDADKASNKLITKRLTQLWPDSTMLAEEDNPQIARALVKAKKHQILWIVDPIDGTTNYAKKVPHAAVSIAAFDMVKQVPVAGVVYDPFRDECFSAGLGLGARLNGKRIKVSKAKKLGDALVATGFSYDRYDNGDNNIVELAECVKLCLDVRRNGAASLDLAWVAAGRFDAYWEKDLKPWDLAAGVLLVLEAGGELSTYSGEKYDVFSGVVVSSNGHLHNKMVKLIVKMRKNAKFKIDPRRA
jgi:myo-inositol-1(or 4)-monophosphatase